MYELNIIDIKRESDYKITCNISFSKVHKEISFYKNDYGIIFISFKDASQQCDDYIRAICIPLKLKITHNNIVEDIKRVHGSTPIFYSNHLDTTSFTYGIVFSLIYNEVFN